MDDNILFYRCLDVLPIWLPIHPTEYLRRVVEHQAYTVSIVDETVMEKVVQRLFLVYGRQVAE